MAAGKKRRWLKVAGVLGVTAGLYLLVEAAVAVFYDPALDLYPGFSPEIARMNYALYRDDPELIRRMPPHLDIVHPKSKTPMRTNSRGFRGPEFEDAKAPGAFRVLFFGDSCLYGFGLKEEDSIPRKVEALLRARLPGRKVECINLAVPGYTSFQGVRLAARWIPRLDPDVVVAGYGFNDSTVRNWTEAQVQASLAEAYRGLGKAAELLSFSPLFTLVRNKYRRAFTRNNIGADSLVLSDPARAVSRVPIGEYERNVREMVRIARAAGARVVLVDMDIPNHYVLDTLRRIARETGVPFVQARAVLEAAAPPGSWTLEREGGEGRWFLVQAAYPAEAVRRGGAPFLARLPLGRVRFPMEALPLRDDGKEGDRAAGDGVWTCRIRDPGGRNFEFAPAVELLKHGTAEEAFINYSTFYRLPGPKGLAPAGVYRSPLIRYHRPSFRKFLVDFDQVHPNARGAELIARSLAPVVAEGPAGER